MDEIKSMLREVLELEGLLMVADSRGDETPDAVFTLIREKVEQLRAVCDCLPEALPEDSEDEELPDDVLDDVPDEEIPVEEPAEEEPVEGEPEVEPEIEVEIEIDEEPEVEEVPEIEEEPEIEVEIEIEEEPENDEESEPEPEPEVEPEEVPEEIVIEEEPEIIKNVDEPAPEETITLDEAFIRNKAKDLKSAFSLNDTFRFRRELFGNSAADMNDAIDLVNAMNSYDEAEDYFINDLGWDAESDEVREFMEIIRNHFIAQ
ncbi:MAG: hypothetical protein ACI31D_05645 [Candidatus Limisoma sp.]